MLCPIQMTINSIICSLYWRTYNSFYPFKYLYFNSIIAHARHNWPCWWVLFVFRTLGLLGDYKGMSARDNGIRHKKR
jgi:hypothetical protein